MNVKLLCEKSFSSDDEKIVDSFVEFQEALIDADIDKLGEILSDDFEYCQIPGKSKTKSEFISLLSDKSLDFSTSEIMEPTILFDDDAASMISKVRLTAEVNGRELRWISDTVASFEMIDGNWHLVRWDS
jgi:hypothetical protein